MKVESVEIIIKPFALKYFVMTLAPEQGLKLLKDFGIVFIVMKEEGARSNSLIKMKKNYIVILVIFLSISSISFLLNIRSTKADAAEAVYGKNIDVELRIGSCPISMSSYSQKYMTAEYTCQPINNSGVTIRGDVSDTNCVSASELTQMAKQECVDRAPSPSPATPTNAALDGTVGGGGGGGSGGSWDDNPAKTIGKESRCEPDAFVKGTYCTGPTSCYDLYCNSDGTAHRLIEYSGSQVCAHCQNYTCEANSFIKGTYYNGHNDFDIYCNGSGNATIIRDY